MTLVDKAIWWFCAILLFVILLDEYLYKSWKLANRGEHWWHLKEKTALQQWTNEVGNSQLNTYYRQY